MSRRCPTCGLAPQNKGTLFLKVDQPTWEALVTLAQSAGMGIHRTAENIFRDAVKTQAEKE